MKLFLLTGIIGSDINNQEYALPMALWNCTVTTAPRKGVRNTGNNHFVLLFLVVMIFGVLVPIRNVPVFFQFQAVHQREFEFVIEGFPFAVSAENFRCKLRFGFADRSYGQIEMLDEIHHGVEFVNALKENFNRFLHIVSAVVHHIFDFRFRQFSVYFERNIGFLDAVSHKPFKGFQTPVGVQHHIVVQKGNFAEHRRILPTRLILLDDEVIDFLRVETAKDAFQDVLVIMPIVEACPNFVFVRFV